MPLTLLAGFTCVLMLFASSSAKMFEDELPQLHPIEPDWDLDGESSPLEACPKHEVRKCSDVTYKLPGNFNLHCEGYYVVRQRGSKYKHERYVCRPAALGGGCTTKPWNLDKYLKPCRVTHEELERSAYQTVAMYPSGGFCGQASHEECNGVMLVDARSEETTKACYLSFLRSDQQCQCFSNSGCPWTHICKNGACIHRGPCYMLEERLCDHFPWCFWHASKNKCKGRSRPGKSCQVQQAANTLTRQDSCISGQSCEKLKVKKDGTIKGKCTGCTNDSQCADFFPETPECHLGKMGTGMCVKRGTQASLDHLEGPPLNLPRKSAKQFLRLQGWEILVILDDSSSMTLKDKDADKSRWAEAHETLQLLTRTALFFDDSGIDLWPLNLRRKSDDSNVGITVRSVEDLNRYFTDECLARQTQRDCSNPTGVCSWGGSDCRSKCEDYKEKESCEGGRYEVETSNQRGLRKLCEWKEDRAQHKCKTNHPFGTPLTKTLKAVQQDAKAKGIQKGLVLILSDGEPTGTGKENPVEDFKAALKNLVEADERDPDVQQDFRVQIMACTNNKKSLEWLNDLDKDSGEIDVTDDYLGEKKEYMKAGGKEEEFTREAWIFKALIGAIDRSVDELDE